MSGCEPLQDLRSPGEGAAVRPEELVRRADDEVRARRRHVDRDVRGEVHGVDEEQGARGMHHLGDGGQVGHGADQVGGAGHRHQPGGRGDHPLDLARCQLAGLRVEVGESDGGAHGLGGQHPGAHVGVVVEPGHHDLVARTPVLGQGAREVEGQLGHAAPEDDAAGVGTEQVSEGGPGPHDGGVGVALRRRRRPTVGERGEQGVVHRLGDHVGGLGATGPVEVGGAVTQ